MKLLVIIPTYNEIENISKIVPAVFDVIPENAGLLVVDDGSPDGTGNAVKEMLKHYDNRLFLLERKEKSGLANAYIAGFNWGLDAGYDVFCEMDADFSHKPEYLPVLYKEIQTYDVAIGSRNIKGGGVESWSALRNFISKGGSLYSNQTSPLFDGEPTEKRNLEWFNPMLMVKDFYADGTLKQDNTFMTQADTPALAVTDVLKNPINPFTGNEIKLLSTEEKYKNTIISFSKANAVRSTVNNGYKIQDDDWFTVTGSIFKKDNWKQLKVQNDVLLEE